MDLARLYAGASNLTFVAAKLEKEWLDKALERIGMGGVPSPMRDENSWSQIFAFEVPPPAKDDKG